MGYGSQQGTIGREVIVIQPLHDQHDVDIAIRPGLPSGTTALDTDELQAGTKNVERLADEAISPAFDIDFLVHGNPLCRATKQGGT